MLSVLFAILGISILVIVHESGHYFAARAFGMRVIKYSIGLGPVIARYQPPGSPTTFQVCAVPFLAYVQIAGMNPHEETDPDDPGLFQNKGLLARIVTVAAGPAANYALASIIVFGLALHGWPTPKTVEPMTVASVQPGSPAAEAGIEAGDVIVEAQGQAIANVDDLIEVTAPLAGEAVTYRVRRDGQLLSAMTITPEDVDGRGVIGVAAKMKRDYVPMSFAEATQKAFVFPVELTVIQLEGIADLVRKRSTEGLTGPVGMGKIVAEQADRGLVEYLSILMLLSLALGLFNLLPIPALDGGRLVFLFFEMITRQKPPEKIEALVHAVGLALLLALLIFVTFRDVTAS